MMPICASCRPLPDASRLRIAVVGVGFSGPAAAAALLKSRAAPLSLALIDAEGSAGAGLSYGKAAAGELPNVRACDLSLLAGERGDFARWLISSENDGRDPRARAARFL